MTDREDTNVDKTPSTDQEKPSSRQGNEHAIAGGMSPAEREVIGRRGYDEGEDEGSVEDEEH